MSPGNLLEIFVGGRQQLRRVFAVVQFLFLTASRGQVNRVVLGASISDNYFSLLTFGDGRGAGVLGP